MKEIYPNNSFVVGDSKNPNSKDNTDLEESQKFCDKELATLSFAIGHDFRNALNQILSFLALLEQHTKNSLDEKSLHFMEIIKNRGAHLEKMIKAIQQYGTLAKAQLHYIQIDTNKLIQDIIKELQNLDPNANIEWKIESLPDIYADPILLKELFKCLIENAMKFSASRKPGIIKISKGEVKSNNPTANNITIIIQDNGIGFDALHADRLFWPFQHFHEEAISGLGMGLATVQRIVHMHQGNIDLQSTVDQGTTVSITFSQQKKQAAT